MTKLPPDQGDSPENEPEGSDAEKIARRKLLKLGAYAAPAIIGTLLISRDAQAQTISCGPGNCSPTPCNPVPCDPKGCPPIR
ncbi:MAG TPA: hypothetical protein VGK67_35595 [Myxococcales bacterium]|jgi:hypothetical protein